MAPGGEDKHDSGLHWVPEPTAPGGATVPFGRAGASPKGCGALPLCPCLWGGRKGSWTRPGELEGRVSSWAEGREVMRGGEGGRAGGVFCCLTVLTLQDSPDASREPMAKLSVSCVQPNSP